MCQEIKQNSIKQGTTFPFKSRIFLALVHYPVYNRNLKVISTSITNMDLHDITRVAATYNIEKYFVVHPLKIQRQLAWEIIDYWKQGYGAKYNQDRKQAFECLELASSLDEVKVSITSTYPGSLYTVATDARVYPNSISYRLLREQIEQSTHNYLLLFGTGWGLERSLIEDTDYILEPVYGRGDYNHLSVRSAVAIIIDRLLGANWRV